jgi:hypothetical protein
VFTWPVVLQRARELSLSSFGTLILPAAKSLKNFVVFYPPATGEKGQQKLEAEEFRKMGIGSLLYRPPYLRAGKTKILSPGGPGNIDGETALWNLSKKELTEILNGIHVDFGLKPDRVALVGKNLGGSVAAFAGASEVGCLIISGSAPQLSRFWIYSNHLVAQDFRKGFSPEQLSKFRSETRKFDLVSTLPACSAKVMVQLGYKDPWIEEDDAKDLIDSLRDKSQVEWIEDDHSMNGVKTRKQRQEFLKIIFSGLN